MVFGAPRVSPRQALLIVARDPAEPALAPFRAGLGADGVRALLHAALRDAIAAAIRVDGTTATVVCPSAGVARELSSLIPAGIDVIAADAWLDDVSRFALGFEVHRERAFERIVAVRAETIGLSQRVLGTAFSVLGGAAGVVGPSRGGGTYLLGLRAADVTLGLGCVAAPEGPGLADAGALRQRMTGAGLTTRSLEPRPMLTASADLAALRETVAADDGARHLAAFLRLRDNPRAGELGSSGHLGEAAFGTL